MSINILYNTDDYQQMHFSLSFYVLSPRYSYSSVCIKKKRHPSLKLQKVSMIDHVLMVKPASNDFGCICEQSWKYHYSMEVYITIDRTKSYCSKLLIKLVITTKNFFSHSLCYLSELLSLVTCKQRADHFTPMMWFDFIRWRFHFIRRLFHYSN